MPNCSCSRNESAKHLKHNKKKCVTMKRDTAAIVVLVLVIIICGVGFFVVPLATNGQKWAWSLLYLIILMFAVTAALAVKGVIKD